MRGGKRIYNKYLLLHFVRIRHTYIGTLARSLDLGTLVYQRWLTKVEPWFTNVG